MGWIDYELQTLLLLIGGHFLCDYPLQGDYMAKAKADFQNKLRVWILFGHASIHGSMVAIITGSTYLGIIEMLAHFVIDESKVRGWIPDDVDQLLHFACKFLIWIVWLMIMLGTI